MRWFERRLFELRTGHGVYTGLLLSLFNFLLITHRLLVERVPFLENIFANLTVFALVSIPTYLVIAILVGHYGYRKRQLGVEQVLMSEQNPYLTKIPEVLERLERIERMLRNAKGAVKSSEN